jgi:cell division protein FtsI/penicillin-binding protein 2
MRMKTRIAALTLVLVLIGAAGAFVLARGGDDPARTAMTRYLAAWTQGDDPAAAALTDRPRQALAALRASRAGLDGARVHASLAGDGKHATVRWLVPGIGAWRYEIAIAARESGDEWRVRWRDALVHPRLAARTRLGTSVERPRRAPILDRRGRRLVAERPVVDIGLQVDVVRDAGATADALGRLLDVDAGALRKRIEAAGKGRFVPVITLREPAFEDVEQPLQAIKGVSLNRTTAPLAPTPTFARALLGSVGPVTAEQVERSRGRLADGDAAGQSGLEASFDARLAGTATRRILVRDRETGDATRTLLRIRGHRGRPLRTLLDGDVQAAAEQALEGDGEAALVAVQPSTGDVLAVADRPGDSSYDRALLGRYPPGSTFKVISTAALLRAGLSPAQTVDCPPTITVEGKSFRNFEGGAAGAVPFQHDFEQSCNTAFVSLAKRLGRDDLTRTARDFGLGEKLAPGVPAPASGVPPAGDAVGHAAMMIGQDRILASPLAMAGVAATVADGRWHAPRLLPTAARRAGPRLGAGELATLRTLMRGVVTRGTGTALAGLPGDVIGKSGTAEFGGGDPPPTHAWFIAARSDIAVAVLVERGASGGRVAAPIARRFLDALG